MRHLQHVFLLLVAALRCEIEALKSEGSRR